MGVSEYLSSSNPVYIIIMRNSRGKLFVYVAVVSVLCFIVFLLSSTHNNLKELEGLNERCQQQRDSLSAQLQVVYEHKNRLEKSLQQEKTDHRQTKDLNEKQATDLDTKLQKLKEEKQKAEAQLSLQKTSYSELEDEKIQLESTLKQQLKAIQIQKDTEIEKLQAHISDLLSEKDKLENSNNGFIWKIQQHENEINLCQAQLQQSKVDLTNCKESGKHTIKDIKTFVNEPVTDTNKRGNVIKLITNNVGNYNEITSKKTELKKIEDQHENKTVSAPPKEKPAMLEKPAIIQGNNIGDGVLPKPMDVKPENGNKDFDAAIEDIDIKKNEKLRDEIFLNNVNEKILHKLNTKVKENKILQNDLEKLPLAREAENHPQVAPPNVDEKDDHGGERGEDGFQYANPDVKQVEMPDFKKQNEKASERKTILQDNDIVAQVNDMMNKSPGEINKVQAEDQQVLYRPPAPHLDLIGKKVQELKNIEGPFMMRGADAHHAMDDKNYDEADDDDRENDDEAPNGAVAALKGANVLQDNDFDDQENQDNGDNAREVEGVVFAPK